MNKAELVDKVAEATGMPKKDVEEVLAGVINAVVAAVQAGEKVALPGSVPSISHTARRVKDATRRQVRL